MNGKEIAESMYRGATAVLDERFKNGQLVEYDLVTVLLFGECLKKKCPEMRTEISFLMALGVRALSREMPANKMIGMLDPDRFNDMVDKLVRKTLKKMGGVDENS